VAAVGFADAGAFGQSDAALPVTPRAGPRQVICRPCGEVPPPKGYSCSGSVMIADSVATRDIPRVTAACQKGEPATAADKNQNAAKAPAPKTKASASKTHCGKKKKAAAHHQPPAPSS
jgi:hypothetical protein